MAVVTILGAGDMGTALATPLAANGHDVRLWGTDRDTAIVRALQVGEPHPRLGASLPRGVRVFSTTAAPEALAGAEIVVVAITSDAVRLVLDRVAPHLGTPRAIVTVAKGFDPGLGGSEILLLPEVIAEFSPAPVVAVGGPSKANEVARATPTMVVFASEDQAALTTSCDTFRTGAYLIELATDVTGVEIAAAMKNAYAIALGISDGLERTTGLPHHNLRAALFPRAVQEMGTLIDLSGGARETANGLAGSGDLQVTITSGRNRLLGERIGRGETAGAAVAALTAVGTTVEGYLAASFGYRLAQRFIGLGDACTAHFALLDALHRILSAEAPPLETLLTAIGQTPRLSVPLG